ncbi:unnamed protein product [Ectocarpus sp. CCAP 1310/34]|nr:unnamed protein product [Ectocarpus sp. CCAP 1310/34]
MQQLKNFDELNQLRQSEFDHDPFSPPFTIASLSPPVVRSLCPLFPHDRDTFNCLLSPAAVISFKDKDSMKNVNVSMQYTTLPRALSHTGMRVYICSSIGRTSMMLLEAMMYRETFDRNVAYRFSAAFTIVSRGDSILRYLLNIF